MRERIDFIVYLVGLMLFGFLYTSFKAYCGGGIWFVVAAIAYLLALRALGYWLKKRVSSNRRT